MKTATLRLSKDQFPEGVFEVMGEVLSEFLPSDIYEISEDEMKIVIPFKKDTDPEKIAEGTFSEILSIGIALGKATSERINKKVTDKLTETSKDKTLFQIEVTNLGIGTIEELNELMSEFLGEGSHILELVTLESTYQLDNLIFVRFKLTESPITQYSPADIAGLTGTLFALFLEKRSKKKSPGLEGFMGSMEDLFRSQMGG